MRLRFTVFLLVLNVITISLIVVLSKRADDNSIRAGGLSGMISREAIEATRIEISGKGVDEPRVLERKGSSWEITQPIQWSANYFAINRILNQLQFLEEEAAFSIAEIERTGQTLADYGLEDPWVKLSIINEDERIELGIGSVTEIGKNFYILGPNKKNVFVISRQFIDGLLVDLNDLRNREIFNIPVFEVQALSLQINNPETTGNSNFKIRIARTGNGWMFESPLTAEANASQVSSTINTLTAARVVKFNPSETGDPILQGLEDPTMRITLHGNKRQQTLLIGNKIVNGNNPPTYYARIENNPTVFTVEAETFDSLREAEETLRERSILNFKAENLTSIDLSEGDLSVRLQKLETGNWQVIESNTETGIQPYRADSAILTKLIENLKNLRASGFAIDSPTPADLDRLGFNNPRRKVQLTVGDQQIVLLLAHPENENEKLYARSNNAEYIYTVDRRTTLNSLPLNAAYYRNRTLEELPEAARITSIQLDKLTTGKQIFAYSLENPGDLWLATLIDLPEKERNSLLTLLDAVRKFAVKEYLIDGYSDSYPLDSKTTRPWVYKLSAEMLLPDDENGRTETRTYVFTERFSGTSQVGASKLYDVIFSIPQATIEALFTFTDEIQTPPEATGQPLPEASEIVPLPEPERTIDETEFKPGEAMETEPPEETEPAPVDETKLETNKGNEAGADKENTTEPAVEITVETGDIELELTDEPELIDEPESKTVNTTEPEMIDEKGVETIQ
jgi:hypothetical protein